jgi:hypothetical protein
MAQSLIRSTSIYARSLQTTGATPVTMTTSNAPGEASDAVQLRRQGRLAIETHRNVHNFYEPHIVVEGPPWRSHTGTRLLTFVALSVTKSSRAFSLLYW